MPSPEPLNEKTMYCHNFSNKELSPKEREDLATKIQGLIIENTRIIPSLQVPSMKSIHQMMEEGNLYTILEDEQLLAAFYFAKKGEYRGKEIIKLGGYVFNQREKTRFNEINECHQEKVKELLETIYNDSIVMVATHIKLISSVRTMGFRIFSFKEFFQSYPELFTAYYGNQPELANDTRWFLIHFPKELLEEDQRRNIPHKPFDIMPQESLTQASQRALEKAERALGSPEREVETKALVNHYADLEMEELQRVMSKLRNILALD